MLHCFLRAKGKNPTVPDVNDRDEMKATRDALSILGISDIVQTQIFSILAGILHMGDIEIVLKSRRAEDARIPEENTHLPVAARLLGVDPVMLNKWIVNRRLQTGKEVGHREYLR